MERSDNLLHRRARALFAFVLTAAMFPLSLPAAAYERQEAMIVSGGTEVSVYAGTRNSIDQENDPEDSGDYLQISRFWTPGRLESTSNITSSANFVRETAPDSFTVRGGVEGVSWDAAAGTLTLDNASGTVITIEGPEINAAALNIDRSGPPSAIDRDMPNLTYYKQYDLFTSPGDESAAAPHTRENSTVQDVITVRIEGENFFNNIRLRGNVKVIFTGGGTLTLEAGGEWDYDDDPDPLGNPAAYALSSWPTIGWGGSLEGTASAASTMPDGTVRTVTEDFAYHLPDIDLNGIQITTGGTIQNNKPVRGESYFTFAGETAPTDESRKAGAAPEDAGNTATVRYDGKPYDMFYNDAKTAFYVIVTSGTDFADSTDSADAVIDYYDVSDSVTAWTPWESYIGTDGVPARKVVLGGGADAAAARSQNVSLSAQKLILDGRTIVCRKYNINEENYFKLRDLACLLTGTPSAFSVEYDGARELIAIVTGAEYQPDGSELDPEPEEDITASPTLQSVQVDGEMIDDLAVYSVDGSNYFNLRELSALLGFGVDYIASDDAVVVRSDPAAQASAVRYIVNNTDTDTTTTNAQYDGYFKEGDARTGVRAILAAGGFSVNGFALPATEEELEEAYPDGWGINGETLLKRDGDGRYAAGSAVYDTYAGAAYAVVEQLPDGLEVALLDSDGDGFVDRIEAEYYGTAIVDDPAEIGDDDFDSALQ